MPATEAFALVVPSFCKFLFDSPSPLCADECYPASLPYLVTVNLVMAEASFSVASEKESGMLFNIHFFSICQ